MLTMFETMFRIDIKSKTLRTSIRRKDKIKDTTVFYEGYTLDDVTSPFYMSWGAWDFKNGLYSKKKNDTDKVFYPAVLEYV